MSEKAAWKNLMRILRTCIVPRLQFQKEQQFPQARRSPTLEVQVFLLEIIYILVYH